MLAGLGLAIGACCHRPVAERMEWAFPADGAVEVRTRTTIDEGDGCGEREGRKERIEALRDALARHEDLWAKGIAAAGPLAESLQIGFEKGKLVSFARRATFSSPKSLQELLSPFGINVGFETRSGVSTIELFPGRSGRGSRREIALAETLLGNFSEAARDALEVAKTLGDRVDADPLRRRAAWGAYFEPFLPPESRDREAEAELSPEDVRAVERLGEATEKLIGTISADDEGGYSLDEIVERVHDPFPARLEIELPAEPEEASGFVRTPQGKWALPPRTLVAALRSLEGEWIAPDPISTFLDAFFAEEKRLVDLDRFLATPRRVEVLPSAERIRGALVARLSPSGPFRLRWRVPVEGRPAPAAGE